MYNIICLNSLRPCLILPRLSWFDLIGLDEILCIVVVLLSMVALRHTSHDMLLNVSSNKIIKANTVHMSTVKHYYLLQEYVTIMVNFNSHLCQLLSLLTYKDKYQHTTSPIARNVIENTQRSWYKFIVCKSSPSLTCTMYAY